MTASYLSRIALFSLLAPGCWAWSTLQDSDQRLKGREANVSASFNSASQIKMSRQSDKIYSEQWNQLIVESLKEIDRHGAGGYSAGGKALSALIGAFSWDEKRRRPRFAPEGARPSFCSGAVYSVLLSALMKWDAAQPSPSISPEAWKTLFPRRAKDGVLPWGYANANGPGFALLIRELGAGYSFTDARYARPGDVMKIWWNDAIGGRERGHIVIFIKASADSVTFWSSNLPRNGARDGYGFKTIPRSDAKRVLFTRITNPAAFNRATSIKRNAWLSSLLKESSTWEECISRCGIRAASELAPAPPRP